MLRVGLTGIFKFGGKYYDEVLVMPSELYFVIAFHNIFLITLATSTMLYRFNILFSALCFQGRFISKCVDFCVYSYPSII